MSFHHCATSARRIEPSQFTYTLNKVVFNCLKCHPARVFLHRGCRLLRHAAAVTAGESLIRLTHRIILTRLSKGKTWRKFHAVLWLIFGVFSCVHWFFLCLLPLLGLIHKKQSHIETPPKHWSSNVYTV